MYSRRFYSGERARRSGPVSAPQSAPEKARPAESDPQNSSDTFPRWAVDIPVIDGTPNSEREYTNPRDFIPERERLENEPAPRTNEENALVYPENAPVIPTPDVELTPIDTPEEPEQSSSANETVSESLYEQMGEISSSVRNMTLEDMMLAGLLMMGSSGDCDDEIMLILGLILMIGA